MKNVPPVKTGAGVFYTGSAGILPAVFSFAGWKPALPVMHRFDSSLAEVRSDLARAEAAGSPVL